MNKNLKNNPYVDLKNSNSTNPTNRGNSNFNTQDILSSINTGDLVKGALIGAAATYILTNEDVQKKIFKSFAKMGQLLSGGIEEMKERFEDAKAELEA